MPVAVRREVIEMADNALRAKQRAAEKLVKQLDVLRQHGASDKLLKRVSSFPAHPSWPLLLHREKL
jgi:hypothetical protein